MGWPDDWELPVEVWAAFGADVTADPGTWVFTDLSDRLRADPIRLRAGRSGGARYVSPSTCTVTLDNPDAALTPAHPMSPYWPNVQVGTPLRVSLRHVEDTFGRTSTTSWGATDGGHVWEGYGTGGTTLNTDFPMSGGKAHHSVPVAAAYRTSWLPDLRLRDCRVHLSGVSLLVDDLIGGSVEPGNILLRAQDWSQYYLARVEITAAQAVMCKLYDPAGGLLASTTVAGLTHSGGQPLEVVAEITGSRLSMKVWATGTDEPAGWAVTATDHSLTTPGGVGIRTGIGSGNTNTKPITVSYESMTVRVDRFSGFADQWEPTFQPTTVPGQADSAVRVTASGILRRLSQGTQRPASPMRRTIAATSPLAYWPAEDGAAAGLAGSAVPGVSALAVQGSVPFVAADSVDWPIFAANFGDTPGTAAVADLSAGGQLAGSVPGAVTNATASAWTLTVSAQIPTHTELSGDLVLAEVATPGGTYVRWRLVYSAALAEQSVIAYNSAGSPTTVLSGSLATAAGVWFYHNLSVWQDGATIRAGFRWSDFTGAFTLTGALAGTLAGVTQVVINPTQVTSGDTSMPVGHIALWGEQPMPVPQGAVDSYGVLRDGPLLSWNNEAAHDRLARLCAEDGVPLDMPEVPEDGVQRMGGQPMATPLELYRECADADFGILYEAGFGLGYIPRVDRYNKPVDLTVDLAEYKVTGRSGDVISPILDDQDIRNELTVERRDGSTVVVADQASQQRHGVYTDSVELNLASDDQLASQAGWRAHVVGMQG